MSETEQKKKPTKTIEAEAQKEGEEDLSPSSSPPAEEKTKPPKQRVEIIDSSKLQEQTQTNVKIYKWTKCPYCEDTGIGYDPKRGVYYCGECQTAWQ